MTQITNEIDERLHGLLDRLRTVPALDPQIAAQERANFLAQVEHLAVSPKTRERHIEWIDKIKLTFQRKESSPMISTLLSLVLAISFLFGGTGATVFAVQTSQPDQPLYAVKTWSEQAHLRLEVSPQAKLGLVLTFTNRRMAEISGLITTGKPVPTEVIGRFQEELNQALQLCAGLEDPQMVKALEQIRRQAETQSQVMSAWTNGGAAQLDPALAQLRDRLREQARLAALGETDPDAFRLQIRDRQSDRLKIQLHTPQPTQTNAAGQTPTVTPTGDNNSYGPGPFVGQPTSAPGGYNYGPGPNTTNAGSAGYGPGPQAGTATCTPVSDGTGPGPGPKPTSSGSGGPGPGPQNPPATPEPPGGSGSGGQVTPQGNGSSSVGQTTTSTGNGGRP
jgi:hypothetical protein